MTSSPPHTPALAAAAALAFVTALSATTPASADQTFQTRQYPLSAVAGEPLRAGFVVDVHAQGPQVYAQERYHLSGARSGTAYEVRLSVYGDVTCASDLVLTTITTNDLLTNRAGNANGAVTFRPADAAGLVQREYGLVWEVVRVVVREKVRVEVVAYTTGCQVVQVD